MKLSAREGGFGGVEVVEQVTDRAVAVVGGGLGHVNVIQQLPRLAREITVAVKVI